MNAIFLEISILIIGATIAATIARFLRQPILPAYILVGVLLGPPVFHLIGEGELLQALAHFGIAFLLFLVGVELDLRALVRSGRIAIGAGLLQMCVAVLLGYGVVRALGFAHMEALFLSLALAFSSTIIILKLIGERRELDSLYGKLVVGIMLTQDFIAITILIFFDTFFDTSGGATLLKNIGIATVKGFFLIAFAFLASRYVLTPLFRFFARQSELLFLGAISWCLLFAMLAASLHFSIEVGALLAGVSLSFVPYTIEITNRVKSLRDFFLPIFFATLGGQLLFSNIMAIAIPTLVLSVFVLLISPIIIIILLVLRGYDTRTSFQAGTAIGQVSEFSFILVSFGAARGLFGSDLVGLVALIGLITMTVSTYMIQYSEALYTFIKPVFAPFAIAKKKKAPVHPAVPWRNHVVIVGYGIMGYKIVSFFRKKRIRMLVIDHNPDAIERLQRDHIPAMYGSISDEELFLRAHIAKARMVISTVRQPHGTRALFDIMKRHHVKAKIIVTANHPSDALEFYQNGAAFVLLAEALSAEYVEELFHDRLQKKRRRSIATLHALIRHRYL